MGHGAHFARLTPEYRGLAERLQKSSVAFVPPREPDAQAAWRELLEILYTPADAALAAQLPVMPSPLAAISKRTSLAEDELRPRLDRMADKGLVLDLVDPAGGDTLYLLAPPVVGFFEFSLMRLADHLPKARVAELFERYMGQDTTFFEEVSGAETVIGRTLVHESALTVDLIPEVLDWERASEYLAQAERVSVANCACRHSAHHLGTACAAPLETCLSVGGASGYLVRHGFAREISKEEGLERLSEAREQGLVHIADNVREKPSYICSCCVCCCLQLKSASKHGMPVVRPSGFQAVSERESCLGCGRCARRCPVGAISVVPRPWVGEGGRPERLMSRVDRDKCLGCGVCVGVCRPKAMTMERRPDSAHVPVNSVEYFVRRMMERGRLADLLVDGGAGRGPAFLNAALQAVLSLPPADRLVASEQLKSRFVRFALSRV